MHEEPSSLNVYHRGLGVRRTMSREKDWSLVVVPPGRTAPQCLDGDNHKWLLEPPNVELQRSGLTARRKRFTHLNSPTTACS